MKLKQYQVDAFTSRVFCGNPAAVCPLDDWLDDALMQAIAQENNLAETAFFVPTAQGFALRWFTPTTEVDLCGHATLATAHVLYDHLDYRQPAINFATRSGILTVTRQNDLLCMQFPRSVPQACEAPALLSKALGVEPLAVLAADDYLVLLDCEGTVRALTPDMAMLASLPHRGVCITAAGEDVDFVSRFFAPKYGIPEDPVTGSTHCMLTPFWAQRLDKNPLHARQVSRRGGDIHCTLQDEHVLLAGHAVTFMQAEIEFDH